MAQFLGHMVGVIEGARGACADQRQDDIGTEDQQGPAEYCGEDGRGGLVDPERVFQGYAEIAGDEDQSH
ncbi:hypothetical protein D3C85_1858290 [compost metagenome]